MKIKKYLSAKLPYFLPKKNIIPKKIIRSIKLFILKKSKANEYF